MDDLAISCDRVIDADVKAEAESNDKAKSNNKAKSNDKETKTFPTNFNEKEKTVKRKVLIFYSHF